jgi:hypothetical protein
MTRSNLHLTSCALALAFIWPTLVQATDTRAPRSHRRATVSRGIGFSAVISSPRPPATRRPTTQARPARPTANPNRNTFKRPSPKRPTRQPASLRELNNLRLPTARPVAPRPAVTRPPARRPVTLRPTGRPDRSAGSAVEAPKRNALKTFLDEVNTQGNRPPGRLPERVDRKIFQVDRAGKTIRPVITEHPQRNAATDPDKPVKDSSQNDAASKPESLDPGDNDATSGDAVDEPQESEIDKGPQQLEPAEGEPVDSEAVAPGEGDQPAEDENIDANNDSQEDEPGDEEPVEDAVPAEEDTPANNDQDGPVENDSSVIVLPGFTFVFGGGTRLVYETLYVEDVIGTTGVHIEETVGAGIEEVISLPEVRAGTTYTLSSENLGNTEGHVVILVNELYMNTTVDQWSDDAATVTLPLVGMVKPQRAALLMMNSNGELVESIDVMFLPAKKE